VTERYVPAAGRRAFTRLYDPVVALTMREDTFRDRLREQVFDGLAPNGCIVDVGCGTGTMAIALAAAGADVIGVDGDPEVLAIAYAKPGAAAVQWRKGTATALPIAGESADRVVMSLLLHHLGDEAKRTALTEARRVLRAGGLLHVADWGRPRGPAGRAGAWLLSRVDEAEGLREHLAGGLPDLIGAAGFADVALRSRMRTVWGTLELLSAAAPSSTASACGARG
jgi:ubiquinone/menaquinone biosynthesis C-methylase UbiE